MLWNDQNNKKVAHRDRIKTFLSLVLSRDHNRKLNLNTSQTLIFVINTTVHIWTSLLSALGQVSHLTLSQVTGNDSKKSFTGTKAWGGKLHCWEWETPQRKHTHTHRKTNNSSKMHLCNCIKCGQLALFSSPTAVTRFNTCNCTVRYLNKECGGLPMPREQKKKAE